MQELFYTKYLGTKILLSKNKIETMYTRTSVKVISDFSLKAPKNKNKTISSGARSVKKIPGAGAAPKQDGFETLPVRLV